MILIIFIVNTSEFAYFFFKSGENYGVPFVKILYLTDLAQKLLSLSTCSI